MQHTEKYRFDLIEKEDVFSPDALNENMEKVEGALEREAAARTAADAAEARARADADAALAQRVSVLEGHHIAFGITTDNTTHLGFAPKVVFISGGSTGAFFGVQGIGGNYITMTDDGFYNKLDPKVLYLAWD
jgi:hypothetical protein